MTVHFLVQDPVVDEIPSHPIPLTYSRNHPRNYLVLSFGSTVFVSTEPFHKYINMLYSLSLKNNKKRKFL